MAPPPFRKRWFLSFSPIDAPRKCISWSEAAAATIRRKERNILNTLLVFILLGFQIYVYYLFVEAIEILDVNYVLCFLCFALQN